MIDSTPRRNLPGMRFLKLARLVFSERTVSRVFCPAVADFHEELAALRGSRVQRLILRCRWYCSLLVLLAVVPFVVPVAIDRQLFSPVRGGSGGAFILALSAGLYVATWQFFGWFAAAAFLCGGALASVLRAWNSQHPTLLERRDPSTPPDDPEINLSSIHVGGDIAGLMFAAGSVVIVLLGLPGLWWYFAAALVSSALLAWGRFVWMRDHAPDRRNSISVR